MDNDDVDAVEGVLDVGNELVCLVEHEAIESGPQPKGDGTQYLRVRVEFLEADPTSQRREPDTGLEDDRFPRR